VLKLVIVLLTLSLSYGIGLVSCGVFQECNPQQLASDFCFQVKIYVFKRSDPETTISAEMPSFQ
jgi:hypothetical protein